MNRVRRPRFTAFTLIELMVAMTITILLITLLVTIANSTTKAWKHGAGTAETFSGARGALSLIGRELQGAVIDLDLGYAIQTVNGEPNNFVIKFLSRRTPRARDNDGKEVAAVEKVAYQLAWASRALLPEVKGGFDATHPIPVLIRTCNFRPDKGLYDVFDVKTNPPSYWIRNWGTLSGGDTLQTGREAENGDITEVVADNVLGWRVNPIYWNPTPGGGRGTLVIDNPEVGRFYDNESASLANAKYITSDLKYVKIADSALKAITAESAPRAIEIRLVTVPTNALPRLTKFSEWASSRTNRDIFEPNELDSSPFNNLLKADIQFFDATYFLSSKTP